MVVEVVVVDVVKNMRNPENVVFLRNPENVVFLRNPENGFT
jgi:hypothetical protein